MAAPQHQNPEHIDRPHLWSTLDTLDQKKLALVVAPSGSGKTSLLKDWLADRGYPAIWVSLQSEDNDPTQLVNRLVAATTPFYPELAHNEIATRHAANAPARCASWLQHLAARNLTSLLILDDYQHLRDRVATSLIEFILKMLPPTVRAVIISQRQPQSIGIPRLRANGQLIELGPGSLAFGLEETRHYVNGVLRQAWSDTRIRALVAETEGWILGIKLGALTASENSPSLDRVIEFLHSHIIQKQPPYVQQFLQYTSILERFNGDVCQALTGMPDSRALLQQLDAQRLFLIPQDHLREWYRYNPIFASALQRPLLTDTATLRRLHRLAATWFETHHYIEEAVKHHLDAREFGAANRLLEQHRGNFIIQSKSATLLHIYQRFPASYMTKNLGLVIAYAWTLIDTNRHHDIPALLNRYAHWAEEDIRSKVEIELIRSSVALEIEHYAEAEQHCATVIALSANTDWPAHYVALGNQGVAATYQGDYARADALLQQTTAYADKAEAPLISIWALAQNALNAYLAHNLLAAEHLTHQAQRVIDTYKLQGLPAVELTLLVRGACLLDQSQHQAAFEIAQKAIEAGEQGKRYWSFATHALAILAATALGDTARETQLREALSYLLLYSAPARRQQNWLHRLQQHAPATEPTHSLPTRAAPAHKLSPAEATILRLIGNGASNAAIAKHQGIALSTVKTHINNIYSKLGLRSRQEAMARATQETSPDNASHLAHQAEL